MVDAPDENMHIHRSATRAGRSADASLPSPHPRSLSPTTRYRDYAISRGLLHWESQGITRADSDTGQRYQRHVALGSSILLFARLRNTDRAFWFLGPATYVEDHGEKPMAITWRLQHPLPGDVFAQFAAAVA